MRRALGDGQLGMVPWLLLSERGSSMVLDQLLTQKEEGDLEPGPLWVLFLSHAWGAMVFIQGT